MSLQEEIEQLRAKSAESIPEDIRNVMADNIKRLGESGILDSMIQVGDTFPDFELPDAEGRTVRLEDLRKNGPVVVSFFRGNW